MKIYWWNQLLPITKLRLKTNMYWYKIIHCSQRYFRNNLISGITLFSSCTYFETLPWHIIPNPFLNILTVYWLWLKYYLKIMYNLTKLFRLKSISTCCTILFKAYNLKKIKLVETIFWLDSCAVAVVTTSHQRTRSEFRIVCVPHGLENWG